MVTGVSKVVIEVDDQTRALEFWTETMGFDLHRDIPYGEDRYLEVRTPDRRVILILSPRQKNDRPSAPAALPTSNVFFGCDDLVATYEDLRARGVEFPQPPIELSFGWWSLFQDRDGNRYALHPRESTR